jgi:uncharacterized protein (UPF0335 family)
MTTSPTTLLLTQLAAIRSKADSLNQEEAVLKEQLASLMEEAGGEPIKEEGIGSAFFTVRSKKRYSDEIEAMEEELKEAKKLADDMGDYTVVSSTESLTFRPA